MSKNDFNKRKRNKMSKKAPAEEPFSLKKEILDWVKVIITAVVVAIFLDSCIIVNAVIPSASMEDTIMTNDRIIGNRLAYLTKDPSRGDIVIFRYPDNEKELFIKRVIGTPGDTVEIKNGKVYINNSSEPLDEPYLNVVPIGDFGPFNVPEDSYFMLGDNRNRSADSRFWNQPYVSKKKILGKAAFRYLPRFKKLQ